MTSASRRASRIAVLGLCAAALLAGCGGPGELSLSGPANTPRGYALERGTGYSFAIPRSWRQSSYRTDPTQGGLTIVPPGSTPAQAAYPRIDTELSAPTATAPATQDFAESIGNLKDEPTTVLPSGQPLADKVLVAGARVAGAREAKLVTVLGPDQRHERDLVVLAPEGVIELSVAWYPANQQLDPQAIIGSFRLAR